MSDDQLLSAVLAAWIAIIVGSVLVGLKRERGSYKKAAIIGAGAGALGQLFLPMTADLWWHETRGWETIGGPSLSALVLAGVFGAIVGALCQALRKAMTRVFS